MAATTFLPNLTAGHRIPLADIDDDVSSRLGPTRGLGNSQPACFNRQVAMYLAKQVGGWSKKIIGRFYNGRDHSTVCYGIQRIQSLRESDSAFDALLSDLRRQLCEDYSDAVQKIKENPPRISSIEMDDLADRVARKLMAPLAESLPEASDKGSNGRAQ
jgi:hypothetical protein